jgi:putative ABC transport system permease protein
VIGIIADLKMRRLDMAPSPQLYASYLQAPAGGELPITLMIRSRQPETNLSPIIRNAITSLDTEVQVMTTTMEDVRWQKTSTERFRTVLLLLFAATALFLALIGVFGVVSYAVAQRTREIGIRMAIGAAGRSVTSLMIRQSMIPALIGLIGGMVASLWLSRFIASFLYEVSPTNLATFSVATAIFASAAFLASYIPARRAASVDPWATLRHQ